MKWFIILWVIIVIAGIYGWRLANTDTAIISKTENTILAPSITSQPDQTVEKMSLFVPYWGLSSQQALPATYDTYLYFGLQATKTGIDTKEDGYKDVPLFLSLVPGDKNMLLVIRMIDSRDNSAILSDQNIQKSIIIDSLDLAKEKGFSGVVLDLEMSAFPFNSLITQVNQFNDLFSQSAKQKNLTYSVTMYGDTFYRPRPFDLKHVSADADSVYIMAYDLHKASGDQGPNFPIIATDQENYDLGKMLTDYEAVVLKSKLAIVFGLFGYDWPVDSSGHAIGVGQAISYSDIKQKFIDSCSQQNCLVSTDKDSGEQTVTYIDVKKQKHIIWFDSPESVQRKEAFLRSRGIQDFSFWAWSYF